MGFRIGVSYRDAKKAEPYEAALRRVGLEPVALSPDSAPAIRDLDGVMLTGGTDVDPRRYGEKPHPATQQPDRERDEFELVLLQQALSAGVPLLAICRGMQLLNVACGGALVQHLEDGSRHMVRPDAEPGRHPAAHSITIEAGTVLGAFLRPGEYQVNSRHHQAVKRIGNGLVVSARANDGVIEALELDGARFVIAVQWHPEDRIDVSDADRRLFEAFREAAERWHRGQSSAW